MIYKTKEKINTLDCNDLAADLRRILEQGDDLIIDLSNTNYISSSGLRVLLMGLKTFRAKGYDFSVMQMIKLKKYLMLLV